MQTDYLGLQSSDPADLKEQADAFEKVTRVMSEEQRHDEQGHSHNNNRKN